MGSGMLSREEVDDIVGNLCSAVDSNDHEEFLRIFREGANRSGDAELGRDRIMDGLFRVVMREPEAYGRMVLAVLTRAADLSISAKKR